jgi:hypothetical protein
VATPYDELLKEINISSNVPVTVVEEKETSPYSDLLKDVGAASTTSVSFIENKEEEETGTIKIYFSWNRFWFF